MKIFKAFFLLFIISNFVCRAVEKISWYDKGKSELSRTSRTFDQIFSSYISFKGDNEESFDFENGNPLQEFSKYKVNNYPQFGYGKKGEYFYQPSFKGGFQYPKGQFQSDIFSTSISNDAKEKDGLISSLLSKKPLAAAAVIPLSIFVASIAPKLMNHLATGLSSQVQRVQTTVNNRKEFRNIKEDRDDVMIKLTDLFNSTYLEDNYQRFVCSVIDGEIPLPELEYFEIAKSVMARLVQDDKLNKLDMKQILAYMKENSCS